MGTLSPDTAARVAKLVPTLSSDRAGEVAAAAAAIERALKAGGADWHDLGDAIERSADCEPVSHRNQEARPDHVILDPAARAAVLNALRGGINNSRLNAWEVQFVESILPRLQSDKVRVTRRQAEAVDRVLKKLAGSRR